MSNARLGVLVLLTSLWELRERRSLGDISAATSLVDFHEAYRNAHLSPREMDVLYLRFEGCMTHAEVAQELGISPRSVESYQQRAINKIAETLGGDV